MDRTPYKLAILGLLACAFSLGEARADSLFEKCVKAIESQSKVYLICDGVECMCANCGNYDGDCDDEADFLYDRLLAEAREHNKSIAYEYWQDDPGNRSRSDRNDLHDAILGEGGTHVIYYRVETEYTKPETVYDRRTGQHYLAGYNRTKQKYSFELRDLRTGRSERLSGGTGRLSLDEPICPRCRR